MLSFLKQIVAWHCGGCLDLACHYHIRPAELSPNIEHLSQVSCTALVSKMAVTLSSHLPLQCHSA